MSDEPKKRSQAWIRLLASSSMLLPTLYVLSAGPVCRLTRDRIIDHPVYEPLRLVARVPPVGRAFTWYLNVWSHSGFSFAYSRRRIVYCDPD
ncbi:MAG TPA: hypothetical protein VFG04_17570 [Planctomycetaceae bacterium]|jgi:hypothetical protein|nr:hypothetical protein [Planctomycetaceae bacterium]